MTKDYFKFLSDKGESVKLVVLVGPNRVGKSMLIDRLMQNIKIDLPKTEVYFIEGKRKEMLVSKEDMLNKKEVLQIHMIIKKRKREIQRIINEGKIALLEIALTGAIKINALFC